MNYHNFASRLSVSRTPPVKPADPAKKPARKNTRRPTFRQTAAAAAVVLAFQCLHANAAAPSEPATGNPPPQSGVNTATLIVTLVGASVSLLRLPELWRRDFLC